MVVIFLGVSCFQTTLSEGSHSGESTTVSTDHRYDGAVNRPILWYVKEVTLSLPESKLDLLSGLPFSQLNETINCGHSLENP